MRELHFTDPAFRCEVVLSGTSMALYEAARPQFERLKGIRNLGLMAHLRDVAMHTRHQHLIGLMRVFNKLCQQPKGKGLPKSFLWSFWCRLCFGQAGHAALSYDAERSALLASHLDSNFKAALRTLLQPVVDKLAACPKCDRQGCSVRGKGVADANVWFDDLVARNSWRQLHLWIAALKLLQEPYLLPILRKQIVGGDSLLGFSDAEAIKMMVAPGCEWDMAIRNLTRLDFVVRDLAFAGTLGIQLDVDNLVAAADEDHPDWKLLRSLNAYLSETLYDSLEAQTASVLFQRALAILLIKGKVTLEALFGIDLGTALDDEHLMSLVKKSAAGKEVFDKSKRDAWRAWPIKTYIDPKQVPSDVEKAITGHKKGYLSRHRSSRATCFKQRQDHELAIAICHQSLAERPEAKVFVKLCRSLLYKQYPKLVSEQLTEAVFEGLVDRKCQHGLRAAAGRLSELSVQADTLRKAANVVNKRASGRSELAGDFSFRIGGYEYPFRGDPQELRINVMHAALSGDEKVRKDLGITLEEAAELLWDELLEWQSEFFGLRVPRKILALVDAAQDHLARYVNTAAPTSERDLELYAFLDALKHPTESVSFRVTLPNLKLLREGGMIENEYDVVSLVLKGDKNVEVWVWGVTTTKDLVTKRSDDMVKIQALKDLLGGRWEADVRVVTCYMHKDGGDIFCEIDGRQERRHIRP